MINLKRLAGMDGDVHVKADPVKRGIAFVVDSVIAAVIGGVPIFGGILGALFMLFRDALPIPLLGGTSPGKRLLGLMVLQDSSRSGGLDYAGSAKRNWMFALNLTVFIPILGWMIAPAIMVAGPLLILIETWRVFSDTKGRRIGDMMAGTTIVEPV